LTRRLLRELSLRLLEAVDSPSSETNVPQLYLAAEKAAPCVAPVKELCGADGSCTRTSCGEPKFRWAQLPLSPLPEGYKASINAYVVIASLIDMLWKLLGALPFDAYFPYKSAICRPRLGCTHTRPIYTPTRTIIRFETFRPRIVLPTILHYRAIRPRKELRVKTPWLIVREPQKCSTYICPDPACETVISESRLEFTENPLLATGASCSKTRTVLDTIMALLEHSYSRLPEAETRPPLTILGTTLPVLLEKNDESYRLVLWNPSPSVSTTTLVFGYERILDAEAVYPDGTHDKPSIEYDRLVIPVRRHGLVELHVSTRKLPSFLIAKQRFRL